jgi:hypothetical protein
MSVIQRWLFSTLPEVRMKVQINANKNVEKVLKDNLKQEKRGFGNVVFHSGNHADDKATS